MIGMTLGESGKLESKKGKKGWKREKKLLVYYKDMNSIKRMKP